MVKTIVRWIGVALASIALAMPAWAANGQSANLVSVEWLQKRLGDGDLLILDASSAKLHAAGHIPGAISVDLYSYASPHRVPPSEMEARFQAWGATPGRKVVIYDEGAAYMATWVFFELYYHGYPAADLFVLDGGLSKWQAAGGPVTKEPSPAPKKGSFRVTSVRENDRTRLAEFVAASGDPKNHVLVEALDPSYHFGGAKFFDRGGHVPNAVMMPVPDFFNADKTFKSADEIRKMAGYLGIKPEQLIHSHCGGGIAATVPFFAFKFISGHAGVKLYKESQMEWLQDERGLPYWTYDAPYLMRDANWVSAWGGRMMRMYGAAQLSVVDVRPAAAFDQGHVPFAINVPAEVFRSHLDNPRKLAEMLGPAGVKPTDEAVIVSTGGLNEQSALAFVMLERVGQKKLSFLMQSVDEFGLRGFPLTKEPTLVGAPKTPKDFAVAPATYTGAPRDGVVIKDARATRGAYAKVFIASGNKVPDKPQDGKVVHVPYTDLVNADGTPKAASDIWNILSKAGVPRYAEIIVYADDPGAAAVNYVVLKLMGYPDVKVLLG
jgi:3-mercaptopyruvate sulfurtransferase SseA